LGITTMTMTKTISPLGESASEGAARRAARSKEYREHAAMLAPYRVIARAVILARTDTGLTQEQLGAALGTTGSAISRIESGTRPVTLDTLGKLGAALDITFVVGSPRAAGAGSVVVPQDAIEVSAKPAFRHTTGGRSARPQPVAAGGKAR
jgi:transcriptional regulator with XRE-family HTH domain